MKNEFLLSIDLGTSSLKTIITDTQGKLQAVASHEYPLNSPQPGWVEQDPSDWWQAAQNTVRQALDQIDGKILAIGFSGQMHGSVLLGADQQPLAPAIIWADGRSTAQAKQMEDFIGREQLLRISGTIPATGFMGPTLLWLKQNQPSLLEKTTKCLLPKDYLRLILTGQINSEASDASSTALFDIQQRTWSSNIIQNLKLSPDIFPPLIASAQVCGELRSLASEALGLPSGIPVVSGCADQPAQALGNGLLNPGKASITLGSGGQIFVPLLKPPPDRDPRLHIFCHAPPDRWYLLGAMLTAGLSLRWLRDTLGFSNDPNAYVKLSDMAAQISPGCDGLLFLPYLSGERSPLVYPGVRGAFIGLSLHHSPKHLARAVMEGVAFALRRILESIESIQGPVENLIAAGNGLTRPTWRGIVCDVLGRPLLLSTQVEPAGRGAALLAGMGAGIFKHYNDFPTLNSVPTITTEPLAMNSDIYESHYQRFLDAYQKTKTLYRFD